MDIGRHVRGADHRHHLAVLAQEVARHRQPRSRAQQALVLDPEAGRGRARVPGGVRQRDAHVVEARRQRLGGRQQQRSGAVLRSTGERELALEDGPALLVGGAQVRPLRCGLACARHRPERQHADRGDLAGLDRGPQRPRLELRGALQGPERRLPDRGGVERRVRGGEHPARAGALAAQPVDAHQQAGSRQPVAVEGVEQRPQHGVAQALGAALARQVLARGESDGERESVLGQGQRALPVRVDGGCDAERPRDVGGVDAVDRADQQVVGKARLARAEDVGARPVGRRRRPQDGLLERCAAEHHEASAGLHEAADRRPGFERERAAVGQQQDVRLRAAQARSEGLGRVEDGGRQARERLLECRWRDLLCVDGRKSRSAEHGEARRRPERSRARRLGQRLGADEGGNERAQGREPCE